MDPETANFETRVRAAAQALKDILDEPLPARAFSIAKTQIDLGVAIALDFARQPDNAE